MPDGRKHSYFCPAVAVFATACCGFAWAQWPIQADRLTDAISQPAAADLDGDGQNELLIQFISLDGQGDELRAYCWDGEPYDAFQPVRLEAESASSYPPVTVAELDGDVGDELIIRDAGSVLAFDGDGKRLWDFRRQRMSYFNRSPAVVLDGFGICIGYPSGSESSELCVLNAQTGEVAPGWPVGIEGRIDGLCLRDDDIIAFGSTHEVIRVFGRDGRERAVLGYCAADVVSFGRRLVGVSPVDRQERCYETSVFDPERQTKCNIVLGPVVDKGHLRSTAYLSTGRNLPNILHAHDNAVYFSSVWRLNHVERDQFGNYVITPIKTVVSLWRVDADTMEPALLTRRDYGRLDLSRPAALCGVGSVFVAWDRPSFFEYRVHTPGQIASVSVSPSRRNMLLYRAIDYWFPVRLRDGRGESAWFVPTVGGELHRVLVSADPEPADTHAGWYEWRGNGQRTGNAR